MATKEYSALMQETDHFHDNLSTATSCDDLNVQRARRRTSRWKNPLCIHALFLLAHFVILSTFTMLLLKKFTFHLCKPQADTHKHANVGNLVANVGIPGPNMGKPGPNEWLMSSPVNKVIDWGLTFYQSELHSSFVGKPTPEIDDAWEQLLQHTNVRISDDDIRGLNREHEPNVALPDGGYAGLVNVFHELHCLKRLYQYSWPEHYFPNFTPEQHELNRQHNMHCIDQIRQGIMCHGDTQISTYRWDYYTNVPMVNDTAPHQCVNFQNVYNWASDHSIEHMFDPGYLMHPTLGEAYPGGEGSKVGVVTPPTEAEIEEHHKHDIFGHHNNETPV